MSSSWITVDIAALPSDSSLVLSKLQALLRTTTQAHLRLPGFAQAMSGGLIKARPTVTVDSPSLPRVTGAAAWLAQDNVAGQCYCYSNTYNNNTTGRQLCRSSGGVTQASLLYSGPFPGGQHLRALHTLYWRVYKLVYHRSVFDR